MTHISPPGKKNNRSSLLSLENNYRHANGGAKTLTIKKLKSGYNGYITITNHSSSKIMVISNPWYSMERSNFWSKKQFEEIQYRELDFFRPKI